MALRHHPGTKKHVMIQAAMQRLNGTMKGGHVRNIGFGAFSRIVALGSQFVVLILLGKFLEKSTFGDFMIVFSLTRVLSAGFGTGLATLLVYHISRNASPGREASLYRSVTLLSLLCIGAVSIAMAVFAPQIAALFSKPSLVPWLVWLSPFLFFSTLLTVSVGTLDGRGQITRSITMVELIPNVFRLIALPMLVPFGFPMAGVAVMLAISVLLPWLVVAAPLFRERDAGFARLTGWDMQYAGKLTLHSFAAMQMQGLDMLVIGWFFSSTAAADYAIASRVAALIPFFQQVIVRGFMTKAGRALHDGDKAKLQWEIDQCRTSSILLVTLTAVAAMMGFPLLTLFMGHFSGALPILALLAAGALYRSFFPGTDALIRIAGHANFGLGVMLTSAGLLIALPNLLAPYMGVYAVAFAMLVSGVVLNPVMNGFIMKTLSVSVADRTIFVPMLIGLAGTAVAFFGAAHYWSWYLGCLIVAASLIPTAIALRRNRARPIVA